MQDGLLLGCNRAAALGSWSPSRWGHTFDGQTTPKPELNSSVALSGAIGRLRDGDLHRHGRAAHLSHGPDVSVCLEVCSAPRACFELLFSSIQQITSDLLYVLHNVRRGGDLRVVALSVSPASAC